MSYQEKMIIDALKLKPNQTALELWNGFLFEADENKTAIRFLKKNFPDEDQAIRQLLSKLEKENKVSHKIKTGSILKEWTSIVKKYEARAL